MFTIYAVKESTSESKMTTRHVLIIYLIIFFLVIILDSLDLLFLHLLGLLFLTFAVKLSAAVDLICLGIHVGLLEVDIPLCLFLLALLGGLALNHSHPYHGEHKDQGGDDQGFLVEKGIIEGHK